MWAVMRLRRDPLRFLTRGEAGLRGWQGPVVLLAACALPASSACSGSGLESAPRSSSQGSAGEMAPEGSTSAGGADFEEAEPTPTETPQSGDLQPDGAEDDTSAGSPDVSTGGDRLPSDAQPARRCATPEGVSGAPTNVTEMVDLLNALPRPTSVACFMESLERPVSVYATRSPLSAQPAVGEEVPRVFFLEQDLVMSVVIGGPAGETLEFGLRVAPARAVRGELEFPLREAVTEETIRDRIMLGGSSLCANCHRGEQLAQAPFFGGTVVSDVVFPADQYEVGVDRLREMREECGESVDSRCQRLAALFDFGAVQQVPFR